MKTLIISLFLCITVVLSNSQETFQSTDNMLSTYRKNSSDGYSWRQREISYIPGTKSISKEKVLSTIWVTDPFVEPQNILVFYKDDVFKIGTRQAGEVIIGKYKIVKNELLLFQYELDSRINNIYGLSGNYDTVIITESKNLFYQEEISIGGIKYFPLGSERKDGEVVNFNGMNLLIENCTKVINTNVKFRAGPSTLASVIQVFQYSEIYKDKVYSLKKGTIVNLIARTIDSQEIDGISAPWYFIKVFDGYEGFQYGWVFGGFFSDYIKEKESEYWNSVLMELKK